MRLADLHRHLDGSLRRETLHELAREVGVVVPDDMAFSSGLGLEQALLRFKTTVAVLQTPASLCRVASEICEDAVKEGVTTLEIRFAPHLHGDIATVVDAVLEGVAGRAGVVLCALYGDAVGIVGTLVEVASSRTGVVGIDLAGAPSQRHDVAMRDYASPFRRAASVGLGRTVHAGEGRPPREIKVAIEELHADRIGHGTTLMEDEETLALVIDRGITVEACLTSNVHTGVIDDVASHPLAKWLELGVKACICTDNTLLSNTTSVLEHERARKIPGMTEVLLSRAIENGHSAAFRR